MSYLPPTLFGKWTLLIAAVSIFNSAQAYTGNLGLSRKIYSAAPQQVTPLSNRTFGTWTAAVAVVRAIGAYDLANKSIWWIVFSTYALALAHFAAEWRLFRTANFGAGLTGPLVVATTSLAWMVSSHLFN